MSHNYGTEENTGIQYWADHCETLTVRDTGLNIAEHPESHLLGFKDTEHFAEVCDSFDQEQLNPADALAYTVARHAETELEEVKRIAKESQEPFLDAYGDGFLHLNNSDRDITVITAGLEEPPLYALEQQLENPPEVYGARLKQNGSGLEVERYCSGDKKLKVLEQEKGYCPENVTSIAFGNSPNDRDIMEASEEALGRDRAKEYSTLYFENDPDGWSRTTAAIAAEKLLEEKSRQEAEKEALEFLRTGQRSYSSVELEDPEIVNRGPVTEELSDIYQSVKNLYTTQQGYALND